MADANDNLPNRDEVNVVPSEGGTTWVEIASSGTEDEAKLIQGFLEAAGIAAHIENVKFSMEPINFGKMGDIRVYVSSGDESRAQALLRTREREYERLDVNAETVVTDEGPAVIDDAATVQNDREG